MSAIQPANSRGHKLSELQAVVEQARLELIEAEGDLAWEQAAVNAFRMHSPEAGCLDQSAAEAAN